MKRNVCMRKNRGFTLLEVLIAILVLSFGFLAFAGMQLISLRNAHSGTYQTVATQLAREMADNLRANQVGVTGGFYDNPAVNGVLSTNCLTTAGCTVQNMANMDIYMWTQKLAVVLPLGRGHVCRTSTLNTGTPAAPACTNTPGEPYAIKIWWDDSRTGAVPAAPNFVTVFQP
ncbi:MAG: type IV pilus modification protein PilV [Burkholderiales bacterium]